MACVHWMQSQEIITFMVQDVKGRRNMKLPSVVYHLLSTVVMDEQTEHWSIQCKRENDGCIRITQM